MRGEEGDVEEKEDTKLAKADNYDEEEIEVSLNILSNPVNLRIFWITAKHGMETIEVLLYTRSNYNFIQEALVEKLDL